MSKKVTPGVLTPHSSKSSIPKQVSRLKREDDEESWISGEELFTEGSSDEEHFIYKSLSKSKPSAAGSLEIEPTTSKSSDSSSLCHQKSKVDSWTVRSTNLGYESHSDDEGVTTCKKSSSSDDDDEDEILKEEISWKPKKGRGSLASTSEFLFDTSAITNSSKQTT